MKACLTTQANSALCAALFFLQKCKAATNLYLRKQCLPFKAISMKKIKYVFFFCTALLFSRAGQSQAIKGTFAIKNVQTGLLLRVKDANRTNGTPLVSYTPVNWKCMTWDFQQVDGQVYCLKNLFTGKTFQPATDSAAAGTALEEQPVAANAAVQQWEFVPVEKDRYLIRLKGTDLYLTPSADGDVNTAVVLQKKAALKTSNGRYTNSIRRCEAAVYEFTCLRV